MTKQEFIDQIADETGLSRADAARAVDAMVKVTENTLSRGDEISLPGFGKFSVSEQRAKQGVNPQTGDRIQIAAKKAPRFSAGAKLKEAVQ